MEGLRTDTLFLALTRPAMFMGVPYEGFLVNVVGSFCFGLIMGAPYYWLVCVLIHLPMRALASMDHNFFRVRRQWLASKGQSIGSDQWGGSSLGALRVWPVRDPSETIGSV